MDIRRIQTLKNGDEAVGNRTKVKVVKNKMAPPFKVAEFDILYGEGISKEGSVLDMALQTNIVKKSGSWFTYEGDQLGQGRENVRQFLKDNPGLTKEIEDKVKVAFGLIPAPTEEDKADQADPGQGGKEDGSAPVDVNSAVPTAQAA